MFPAWLWITLACLIVLSGYTYFVDRNGYKRAKTEDSVRDSTAVHNATTSYVPTTVNLPNPNPPKLIHGTPIHDTVIVVKRDTIIAYDTIRTSPDNFQATIDDSVQHTTVLVFSRLQSIYPLISYKPQKIQVPQITLTLPPKEIPWYGSPTAKVVEGVIGASFIYGGIESTGSTRLYLSMGGIVCLTVGFAL